MSYMPQFIPATRGRAPVPLRSMVCSCGEWAVWLTSHGLMPFALVRGGALYARNSSLDALQRTAACMMDVEEPVWVTAEETRRTA